MIDFEKKLKGIIPPLITPFNADYSIDQDTLRRLVHHIVNKGADGVFAMGSASEAPMLTRSQRDVELHVIRDVCTDKVPMLVGALESSTARVLELVQDAQRMHADAVVVTAPYYFKVSQEDIVQHFTRIHEETDLPIIIYHLPVHIASGNQLEAETVARIASLTRVIAYKDSSANMPRFQEVMRLTKDMPNFSVFQGVHDLSVASLIHGADGLVLGLGNVVPCTLVQLMRAVEGGDLDTAYALQGILTALDRALSVGRFPLATLKAMAGILGYGNGLPHQPMSALTDGEQKEITNILQHYGVVDTHVSKG